MHAHFRVPATTANLGPGFDVVGMALNLYNEVEMEEIEEGLLITATGEGANDLPCDHRNLVYQAAEKVFEKAGKRPSGLRIHLHNRIPITRGLGSSSAALIGGLAAANALTGNHMNEQELLALATEMEGHPDNVAPALFGGIVCSGLVRGEWRSVQVKPPTHLRTVVAVPNFELPTELARAAVPKQISREDAIFTSSHVGLMIASLLQEDLELFGSVLEDRLHQPHRAHLIPGMQQVIEQAEQAGALGVALSGAGPTIIAFTNGENGDEEAIGEAMRQAFYEAGVQCQVMVLQPEEVGCQAVKDREGMRL